MTRPIGIPLVSVSKVEGDCSVSASRLPDVFDRRPDLVRN